MACTLVTVGMWGQVDREELITRAENNEVDAMNELGNAFTHGRYGLPSDSEKAIEWYQRAASAGSAAANFNLGLAYELSRGVERDETRAFGYYLAAAKLGYAPAMFNVGNMYASGRGTPPDTFEANIWFRMAAEAGIPQAQFNLGTTYETGNGVQRDEAQAARWYGLAAAQGFPLALYNLGLMSEEGRGVPQDDQRAAQYYRAAAEKDVAAAQNNYGLMLFEGRGVAQADSAQALYWLERAVANGAPTTALEHVSQRVSAVDKARARTLIETGEPPPPPAHSGETSGLLRAAQSTEASPPSGGSPGRTPVAEGDQSHLQEPAASAQTNSDAPVGDPTSMQLTFINELQKENDRLRIEVWQLTNQLLWASRRREPTRPPAAPAPDDAVDLESRAGRIEGRAEDLRTENEELRSDLLLAQQRIEELMTAMAQISDRDNPIDWRTSPVSEQDRIIKQLTEDLDSTRAQNTDLELWVQALEGRLLQRSDTVGPGPSSPQAEVALRTTRDQLDRARSTVADQERRLSEFAGVVAGQQDMLEQLAAETRDAKRRLSELLQSGATPPPARPTDAALRLELSQSQDRINQLVREKEMLADMWNAERRVSDGLRIRFETLEREMAGLRPGGLAASSRSSRAPDPDTRNAAVNPPGRSPQVPPPPRTSSPPSSPEAANATGTQRVDKTDEAIGKFERLAASLATPSTAADDATGNRAATPAVGLDDYEERARRRAALIERLQAESAALAARVGNFRTILENEKTPTATP